MLTQLILFVLGLLALVTGARALVRGASKLAPALGVSPRAVSAQRIRQEVPLMIGALQRRVALPCARRVGDG